MSVRSWHWGKIAILWAWGGVVAGLLLTNFITSSPHQSPTRSTVMFLGSLVILIGLTTITWVWLGGKEDR